MTLAFCESFSISPAFRCVSDAYGVSSTGLVRFDKTGESGAQKEQKDVETLCIGRLTETAEKHSLHRLALHFALEVITGSFGKPSN